MISRCIRFERPAVRRMNSAASQSSSSGCVGCSPSLPKSFGGGHEPPAEVVLPDAVHQHAGGQRVVLRSRSSSASTVRRPLALRALRRAGSSGPGTPSTVGKPGFTSVARCACGLPRTSMNVAGGRGSQLFTDSASSWLGSGFFSSSSRSFFSVVYSAFFSPVEELRHLRHHLRPVRPLRRPLVLGRHLLDRRVLDRRHLRLATRRSSPSASLQLRLVHLPLLGRRDVRHVRRRPARCGRCCTARMSRKNATQLVVVGLRDRVELVVVAAGAVERHAEERLPGDGDEVVVPVEHAPAAGRPVRRPTGRGGRSRWR